MVRQIQHYYSYKTCKCSGLWQCWKVGGQYPVFNYYCPVSIWHSNYKQTVDSVFYPSGPTQMHNSTICSARKHWTSKNICSSKLFSVSKHQAQPCHYSVDLDTLRVTFVWVCKVIWFDCFVQNTTFSIKLNRL